MSAIVSTKKKELTRAQHEQRIYKRFMFTGKAGFVGVAATGIDLFTPNLPLWQNIVHGAEVAGITGAIVGGFATIRAYRKAVRRHKQ